MSGERNTNSVPLARRRCAACVSRCDLRGLDFGERDHSRQRLVVDVDFHLVRDLLEHGMGGLDVSGDKQATQQRAKCQMAGGRLRGTIRSLEGEKQETNAWCAMYTTCSSRPPCVGSPGAR